MTSDEKPRERPSKKPWLRQVFTVKTLRNKMILLTCAVMAGTSVFTAIMFALLFWVFPIFRLSPLLMLISALVACTVIGTLLSVLVSRHLYKPFQEMIRAMEKISKGDFKVHLAERNDPVTDIGVLQRSFNHMAEELDGIELFRNDFINNFSHEFKTPIVSIRGFARQLQAGGLTEAQKQEYIGIIADEADRLTKMSTNILLLSRLENQQIVTDKTEFYLDEQIRNALLLLEKQWTAKELELDIDLDEVKYVFNEEMLLHIWLNLIGNAVKFTPSRGTVTVTLRERDGAAVAVIRDTGCGMSADTVKHIFEKFWQGDTSHGGEGNGIGLGIVRRILELCGGRITVDSTPGMGSVFTVVLPIKN